MTIETVKKSGSDLARMMGIWESAVRATHDFLREEDIWGLFPLVEGALKEIPALLGCRNEAGDWIGFVGVDGDKIEMLFVDAAARGCGAGRRLAVHAIQELGARRLDVNEQNPQAVGFYRHLGFRVVGRSALDGQGNPFPLLQMELALAND